MAAQQVVAVSPPLPSQGERRPEGTNLRIQVMQMPRLMPNQTHRFALSFAQLQLQFSSLRFRFPLTFLTGSCLNKIWCRLSSFCHRKNSFAFSRVVSSFFLLWDIITENVFRVSLFQQSRCQHQNCNNPANETLKF